MRVMITPLFSLLFTVAPLACADTPAGQNQGLRPVAVLDAGPAEVVSAALRDDAGLLAREAVEVSPSDQTEYQIEASRLLQAGETQEGILALRKALSQEPSASVWTRLGEAYLLGKDVPRAVQAFEEAVVVDVDQPEARRHLARIYLEKNEGKIARAHAEELVRLAPHDPSARQMLGRALSQVGRWKEAMDAFDLVVQAQPDNVHAYNNLGYAALQIGEHERARESLERCLSLEPQTGYMLNNLGVAYERLGRRAEAHAAFARAAELSPRYTQAAINRDRVQKTLSQEQRLVAVETLARFRAHEAPMTDRSYEVSDEPSVVEDRKPAG